MHCGATFQIYKLEMTAAHEQQNLFSCIHIANHSKNLCKKQMQYLLRQCYFNAYEISLEISTSININNTKVLTIWYRLQ